VTAGKGRRYGHPIATTSHTIDTWCAVIFKERGSGKAKFIKRNHP